MRSILRKTITSIMAVIILIFTIVPGMSAKANTAESIDYLVKVIAENEYSDGVRFGDGYLMLKNGKFDNMNENTNFTFIDAKGNKKEVKNNNGFKESYGRLSGLSGDVDFVDFGVLPIGKDGKMALMDTEGNLYGGNYNYYSAVNYAGSDMFYTTNATEASKDKFRTNIWTLRKKDGTVLKQFENLRMSDRINVNGFEFIFYHENSVGKLIKIDSAGNKVELATGYDSVKLEENYISVHKDWDGINEAELLLLDSYGNKLGEYIGFNDINTEELLKDGYTKIWGWSNGSRQSIIDSKGNLLLDAENYSYVDMDSERILTWDINDNILLKDRNNNIILDCKEIEKELGGKISRANYNNSILSLSFNSTNLYKDSGTTILIDKNGEKISKPLRGFVQDSKNGYIIIADNYDYDRYLVNSKGEILSSGKGYGYTTLDFANYGGRVIGTEMNFDSSIIKLVLSDGSTIDKYTNIHGTLNNNIKVYINENEGLIDKDGNEIFSVGKYKNIKVQEESKLIVAQKDNLEYVFNKKGNAIKLNKEYKQVGSYETIFSPNASEHGEDERIYINEIKKDNKMLTLDKLGKVGLIEIKQKQIEDINESGEVDILDIATLSVKYNLTNKDLGWNIKFDIYKDNIIDIYDIIKVAIKM